MADFLDAEKIAPGPFRAEWESLRNYRVPEWFRDAKFGIWAHWGPQAVPMAGDWYARHLYIEGHPQALHFRRTYGHPSQVGWKDVCRMWKAERFDPAALMDFYAKAGAKYFVAQAVHHDNFDLWDSAHHGWNSVKVGPQRDIVGAWRDAAVARGLKFGVTEHLAASFSWWRGNKGADKDGPYAGVPYDGADPAFADLYHANRGEPDAWLTANPGWHETWFRRIRDLVDRYQPDLLYSDSGLPWDRVGLSLVAHYYNANAARHGGVTQAVYTQKDRNPEVHPIGVMDIERGRLDEAAAFVWQTDTSVGDWYYDVKHPYKTPGHVIEMLVDITAKNGCLLLNIPQRPDGTLDEECRHLLSVLADWTAVNGDGLYGTRPWTKAGEGPTSLGTPGHFEEKPLPWTTADFRFTTKGGAVYAFQMKSPDRREAFVRSLGASSGTRIRSVSVLGASAPVAWRQHEDGLFVRLPDQTAREVIPCIRVEPGDPA